MDGQTIMREIVNSIINPLILLIFAAGVFLFMWGLVVFMMNVNNAQKKAEGQQHMMWGIIGVFIMATVFGIINIIASTIGVDVPKVF